MLESLSDRDPSQVGPFQLRSRIGEGGMGTVYLGFDETRQAAAVKVLTEKVAADPRYRQRFRLEADAARRLVSVRRVARFLGDDQDEQPPWIAFEYVAGVTLAEAVRPVPDSPGRPLPRELLAGLALGLAEALAEIHDRRVVHRDLKPANVVLTWNGPKVIDFGIALVESEQQHTGAGQRIGTPYWMAPEQHVGAELGTHTDVYAWGTCMAYAIFGSWRSREDVLAALAAQESDGGQDMMSVILRNVVAATEREPTRRPSADDLVAQLTSVGRVAALPEGTGARPEGTGARRSATAGKAMRLAQPPAWALPPDLRPPDTPGLCTPGLGTPQESELTADGGRTGHSLVVALAVVAIGVLAAGVGLAAAGTRIGELVGPVAAGNVVALLGLLLAPSRTSTGNATALLAGLAGAGAGLVVAHLAGIDEPARVLLELAGAAVVVAAAAWASSRSFGSRSRGKPESGHA